MVTTHVTTNVDHVTKEVEEAMVMAVVITDPITRDEKRIMMKNTKTKDQEDVDLEVEEVVTDQEEDMMAKGGMTIIERTMGQDQEMVKITRKRDRSLDKMEDIIRIIKGIIRITKGIIRITKGIRRIEETTMIREIDNMIDLLIEDELEAIKEVEVEEEEEIIRDLILDELKDN